MAHCRACCAAQGQTPHSLRQLATLSHIHSTVTDHNHKGASPSIPLLNPMPIYQGTAQLSPQMGAFLEQQKITKMWMTFPSYMEQWL